MPTTPEAPSTAPSVDAVAHADHIAEFGARRSLRRSLERRAAARQARRRRLTGRGSALVLAGVMAVGSAGALAHGGSGGSGSPSRSATPAAARSATPVAAVQAKLGIPADGVAGPQTRRAIRRFQRRSGLTVDGVVGPRTLAALGIAPGTKPAPLTDSMPGKRKRTRRGSAPAPSAALAKIAACESGGNPAAVSANGRYRGKYQFSRATWRAMGGKGDPAAAPEAEQDRLAAALYASQGAAPWPSCGR